MRENSVRAEKFKAPAAFLALAALSALLQCVPAVFDRFSSDAAVIGYFAHAWVVTPVFSAVAPYLCARKWAVHPMAAFFPAGLSLLLSPWYSSMTGIALACLGISLVAATAGAEMRKRKEPRRGKNGR